MDRSSLWLFETSPYRAASKGQPPSLAQHDAIRVFLTQALADAFERDQVEGLLDETTIGQLAGLLYEFDSQGRIKIESKEKARERGVPSPDRADALMLALCKPYESLAASLASVYRPGRGSTNALASVLPCRLGHYSYLHLHHCW